MIVAITAAHDGDALVDAQGLPARLSLTAGQARDVSAAYGLLDQLARRTVVLGGKANDADSIRDLNEAQGAVPNIPAKSMRKWKPCFSKRFYRGRNFVERFFSKLNHFRRVTTRHDKLAEDFAATVRLWLRNYESTA